MAGLEIDSELRAFEFVQGCICHRSRFIEDGAMSGICENSSRSLLAMIFSTTWLVKRIVSSVRIHKY